MNRPALRGLLLSLALALCVALAVELSFDVGLCAPRVVPQTLRLVPPLYLPLAGREGAR